MSNQKLFITQYLNRIGEDYFPNLKDKPRDDMAWEILSLAMVLTKDYRDVWDNVVIRDNEEIKAVGADGGIDGIYFEYNGDLCTMHVFQCKNVENLSVNKLDKFRNNVSEIFFEGKLDGKLNIELIMPMINEYKDLTDKGVIITTKSYFLFSGDKQFGNNKAVYESQHNPKNQFFILDSNDLYEMIYLQADRARNPVKFTFHPLVSNIPLSSNDPQSMYTFNIRDIVAANFRITAIDLCKLIDKEIEINGTYKTLFQENIRGYLGMNVGANENIRNTLKSQSDSCLFPFLNNGITIICDDMLRSDRQNNKNLIIVNNPQIVNGLQTSMVIYEAYATDKNNTALLDDITVNVRLYQVKQKDIIDKITDATNTQSPIDYTDKTSTRPFNLLVTQLFDNAGINYIAKREGGFASKNSKKPSIESIVLYKFWYATFYENPVISKNNLFRVTQDIYEASTISTHSLYNLFNGSKESALYGQFLATYKIVTYVISNKHNRKKAFDFIDYVDELLCYGIYKQIGGDINKYNSISNISEAYEKTLSLINAIIDVKTDSGSRYFSYTQYFKTQASKKDFDSALLNGIEKQLKLL